MTIIVKSRDSLLTTTSGYTNYRGILNLVIILLVLSNARAALENIIKYGILVDPISWFLFLGEGSKHWPALVIVFCVTFNITISLLIEKLIAILFEYIKAQRKSSIPFKSKQKLGKTANNQLSSQASKLLLIFSNFVIFANLMACISVPPILIYTNDTHPISTSASLMLVSIVFLKLVSYHMMNFWCRDLQRPKHLQSRTSQSFLKSYIPPVVDFKPNNVSLDELLQSRVVVKKSANGQVNSSSANKSPTSSNNNNHQQQQNCIKRKDNNSSSSSDEIIRTNGNSKSTNLNCSSPSASKEDQHAIIRDLALDTLSHYPNNLTFNNMFKFMIFPTLNYELDFAQTERIRKRFLIKRIIELIILSQMDMALIQQWIVPTVSNSVLPFRQMQFSHMLERLLKLAIPNHVIWLIWFYLFFHSLLNIIAELTRFADREFYRDWWNSESVYYFWSNWNIPVHKWCARHLYVPLIALGLSKCQASTAVFFVSAFFHEYLVSVPLKLFRMWAFTGMLIQLPMARFVSSYFNNNFANVAVWVSLIIGQPLCILMYYHDYYVINNIKSSS